MDVLLTLSTLFILGGTFGWILELFYRRFAHKRWVNPGFLTGPCLPLYGTGVIVLYLLCSLNLSFIKNPILQKATIIILITIAMTVIEYITGTIFTKKFRLWLWDYTDRFGNIQGVICPLFSAIWGIIGALYFIFLHNKMENAVEFIICHPNYSYFLGIYIGVFAVDVSCSFNLVAKIKEIAEEKQLNVRFESFKLAVRTHAGLLRKRKHFIFPFIGVKDLHDEFEHYTELLKKKNILKWKMK